VAQSGTPLTARGSSRTDPDPEHPWADTHFWLLQMVVLALALVRLAVTVGTHADATDPAVELTTVVIFLLPVVYGAQNYGLLGGVLTSTWAVILDVPRLVGYIDIHDPSAAWVELLQALALMLTAVLIGHRVSVDHLSRRISQESELAQRNAEALYRDLFHSNQAPILIVDANGMVVESNESAQRAFPGAARSTTGTTPGHSRLVDVIGPVAAGQVLAELVSPARDPDPDEQPDPHDQRTPVPFQINGELVLLRPTVTALHRVTGEGGLQIVFEDVTAETQRHQRMEEYAGKVLLGQEEERLRIAQELHDGPVQVLIHLCRQIDAFPAHESSIGRQTEALRDLRGITEGAVDELRVIAKGLRPPILDDLGLVASITQLLDDAGGRSGIATSIGISGQARRLPTAVELAVFRITQEALSNVERHAGATRIAVGLDFEGAGVRLLIRDDGAGFDPSGRRREQRRSLGLLGMAERAHLAGGKLRIHSQKGEGTTVDLFIANT